MFKLFFVTSDTLFVRTVQDQLSIRFPQLPITSSVFDSAQMTLGDLRTELPHMILAPTQHLDMDPLFFERDVHRWTASTTILFLGPPVFDSNSNFLPFPLTDWEMFFDFVLDSLTDEIKQKTGIKRQENELVKNLLSYAKKYDVAIDQVSPSEPLCMLVEKDTETDRPLLRNDNSIDGIPNTSLDKVVKSLLVFEFGIAVLLGIATIISIKFEASSFVVWFFSIAMVWSCISFIGGRWVQFSQEK